MDENKIIKDFLSSSTIQDKPFQSKSAFEIYEKYFSVMDEFLENWELSPHFVYSEDYYYFNLLSLLKTIFNSQDVICLEFDSLSKTVHLIYPKNESENKKYLGIINPREITKIVKNGDSIIGFSKTLKCQYIITRTIFPSYDKTNIYINILLGNRDEYLTNRDKKIFETCTELFATGIRVNKYFDIRRKWSNSRKLLVSEDFLFFCKELLYLELWTIKQRKTKKTTAYNTRLFLSNLDVVCSDLVRSLISLSEINYEIYGAELKYSISDFLKIIELPNITEMKNYLDKNIDKQKIYIQKDSSVKGGFGFPINKYNIQTLNAAIDALLFFANKELYKNKKKYKYVKYCADEIIVLLKNNNIVDMNKNVLTYLRGVSLELSSISYWSKRETELGNFNKAAVIRTVIRLREILHNIKDITIKTLENDDYDYINLNSRWLNAWFFLKIEDSKIIPKVCHPKSVKEMKIELNMIFKQKPFPEILKDIDALCVYAKYVINNFLLVDHNFGKANITCGNNDGIEYNGTASYQESIVEFESSKLWLIARWAEEFDVTAFIPLYDWLKKLYEHEISLYVVSKKGSYRQHLFHMEDVCLLGLLILESRFEGLGKRTINILLENSKDYVHLSERDLYKNWIITALTHDLGNIFSVAFKSLKVFEDWELEEGFKDRIQELKNIVMDIRDKLGINQENESTHAILSRAILEKQLSRFGNIDEVLSEFSTAREAIIDHNTKTKEIDIVKKPLSFLMILCDQIQDWGRGRIDTEKLSKEFLCSITSANSENTQSLQIKPMFTTTKLLFKAKFVNGDLLIKSTNEINFSIEGEYAAEKKFEPAIYWIDFCNVFQKIISTRTGFPLIKISFSHKLRKSRNISEYERLFSFARNNQGKMGYIIDFLNFCKKPNDSIEYSKKSVRLRDFYIERMEFIIPNLGKEKPLKSYDEKLYDEYAKYKIFETMI